MNVGWEMASKGFDEFTQVGRRVQVFWAEERDPPELPSCRQVIYLEKTSVVRGNVFQEREDAVRWMFVAKRVKNEVIFGGEAISIHGKPCFICHREHTLFMWEYQTRRASKGLGLCVDSETETF
jgi:hypothetical protein